MKNANAFEARLSKPLTGGEACHGTGVQEDWKKEEEEEEEQEYKEEEQEQEQEQEQEE